MTYEQYKQLTIGSKVKALPAVYAIVGENNGIGIITRLGTNEDPDGVFQVRVQFPQEFAWHDTMTNQLWFNHRELDLVEDD